METTSYTFKSPYPSMVQIGLPDPSSSSNDSSTPVVNETLQEAQNFASTQVSDVKPTVTSSYTLDTYA